MSSMMLDMSHLAAPVRLAYGDVVNDLTAVPSNVTDRGKCLCFRHGDDPTTSCDPVADLDHSHTPPLNV